MSDRSDFEVFAYCVPADVNNACYNNLFNGSRKRLRNGIVIFCEYDGSRMSQNGQDEWYALSGAVYGSSPANLFDDNPVDCCCCCFFILLLALVNRISLFVRKME